MCKLALQCPSTLVYRSFAFAYVIFFGHRVFASFLSCQGGCLQGVFVGFLLLLVVCCLLLGFLRLAVDDTAVHFEVNAQLFPGTWRVYFKDLLLVVVLRHIVGDIGI